MPNPLLPAKLLLLYQQSNIHISKMYFGCWEPLGMSESCRTRNTGWSNPRVNWTDVVGFRWTWEHIGVPAASLEALTTNLGAPGSAGNMPQSVNQKPESANDRPGSILNHSKAVWERHHRERYWYARKS